METDREVAEVVCYGTSISTRTARLYVRGEDHVKIFGCHLVAGAPSRFSPQPCTLTLHPRSSRRVNRGFPDQLRSLLPKLLTGDYLFFSLLGTSISSSRRHSSVTPDSLENSSK